MTQANENILVNFSADRSRANLQLFAIEPATPFHHLEARRGGLVR
jgi:hypothetical protein